MAFAARPNHQGVFFMTVSLSTRDKAVVWHPFTQHKNAYAPVAMVAGEGAYLIDDNGKRYLDMISSWWVNIHGHAQPDIAKAIYEQALTLEHVIFAGFTHPPAVELAEKLLAALPPEFARVFFSDNGSTSVEIALKMAYQYWRNRGEANRKRFMAFTGAYHGDTVGCMSVGKSSGYYSPFHDLLFSVDMFPYPSTWLDDVNIEQKELDILAQIAAHLDVYGKEISSIIIEPLIQGSIGMRMCRPQFLKKLEILVRQHGIIIIYDEVMTGFGRTGSYFACQKAQTTPDIICLSKGITGGFLPFAVTVCQDKIFQAFLGDSIASAFTHGHSYTANPLGCAAALASLKILQSQYTINQMAMIETVHQQELAHVMETGVIVKARYCGTVAAFDLKLPAEYGSRRSLEIQNNFLKKGLLVRLIGKVIYFLPPYCITENELRNAYHIVIEELQGVTA
jgi:adenosylmethionine-8-amino-7-oxononanoate aminotransferase